MTDVLEYLKDCQIPLITEVMTKVVMLTLHTTTTTLI